VQGTLSNLHCFYFTVSSYPASLNTPPRPASHPNTHTQSLSFICSYRTHIERTHTHTHTQRGVHMCMSYQLQQGPLSHSLALSSHHIIHRDWLRAQHAMLAHSLTHTFAHSLRLNRRVRAHSLTHSQIPVHIPTQWPVLY